MNIEIPGLDISSGLDLCDGDENIFLNVLRLYVSGIPSDLEKMKGVSAQTLADYSVAAHSIKSMNRYIGAEDAREAVKELEMMAKSGDLAGVLAKNEAFIKLSQGIVENIKNWLKNNGQSG